MASTSALPVRIGLLYDFPQGDDLFAKALRLGIDDVAATGRLDRDVELVERQARGLPSGTEADVVRAFRELCAEDVLAIAGPSISDNALIAAPLCDDASVPAINYSGGERTRSQWMFHYQVGSLEEEPPVLAARMAERGMRRAAVVFDQSPVGRRYAECFEAARARLGLEVTGTASISPLAADAEALLDRLRQAQPDVLVYFGLGLASRAVAVARLALAWDVPVLANSALMFGYACPTGATGTPAGSTSTPSPTTTRCVRHCANGSRTRRPAPSGVRRTTSVACSARASPRPSTSRAPASRTACAAPSSFRRAAVTPARSWASACGITRR